VAAPGRVNLIGEHIDYSDGFVLPMAIDRYTMIAAGPTAARPVAGEQATFVSDLADDEVAISLAAPKKHATHGHWSNYVAGVIAGCVARGLRPNGFRAVIGSDVPLGGGLSSSAALEVATATLVEAMTGVTLDPVAKALLCQQAEHEYAGVPCGIMDQFASALSEADHLMLLDCRSRRVELIPFTDPGVTVLIINTNVKHELSGGEYAQRRGQCEAAARKLGVSSLRDATLEQLAAARGQLAPVEYQRSELPRARSIGRVGRRHRPRRRRLRLADDRRRLRRLHGELGGNGPRRRNRPENRRRVPARNRHRADGPHQPPVPGDARGHVAIALDFS
jgi:galactokinase